jgi:hypothetical protein
MQWSTRSRKFAVAAVAIAIYFTTALLLKYTYVPLQESRILLKGPFVKFGPSGVAYARSHPSATSQTRPKTASDLQLRYLKTSWL